MKKTKMKKNSIFSPLSLEVPFAHLPQSIPDSLHAHIRIVTYHVRTREVERAQTAIANQHAWGTDLWVNFTVKITDLEEFS